INEPVRPWYAVGQLAQDEIVRVTGCHPYFTQLVCKKLLEVRNEAGVNRVGLNHVQEAIDRALHTGAENIGFPWKDECRPEQRLVLAVLAGEGEGQEMSLDALYHKLMQGRPQGGIKAAVEELWQRGVLRQHQGQLSFAVPLLQRWLSRQGYDTLEAANHYN